MNRCFLLRALGFAVLYYLVVLFLHGVIFLCAHIPPKAVNLDWLLSLLGFIAHVLAWPRPWLRRLWPGETTPAALLWILQIVTCLLWGLALAGVQALRHRRR